MRYMCFFVIAWSVLGFQVVSNASDQAQGVDHSSQVGASSASEASENADEALDDTADDSLVSAKKRMYVGVFSGVGSDHWARFVDTSLNQTSQTLSRVDRSFAVTYGGKIGYVFGPLFQAEAAVFSMPSNTLYLSDGAIERVSLYNFALLGRMNVDISGVHFYTKAGGAYRKQYFSGAMKDRSQFSPVFGLGDTYRFSSSFSFGVDYTHFMSTTSRRDPNDMPSQDMFMLSLEYYFH